MQEALDLAENRLKEATLKLSASEELCKKLKGDLQVLLVSQEIECSIHISFKGYWHEELCACVTRCWILLCGNIYWNTRKYILQQRNLFKINQCFQIYLDLHVAAEWEGWSVKAEMLPQVFQSLIRRARGFYKETESLEITIFHPCSRKANPATTYSVAFSLLQAAEVGKLEAAAKLGEVERGRTSLKARLGAAERADVEGRELVARLATPHQWVSQVILSHCWQR